MFVDFNPMTMNGFTTYVMNSDQKARDVMNSFELAFSLGITSEEALKYALNMNDTSLEEFTDPDKQRILRKVSEMTKARDARR